MSPVTIRTVNNNMVYKIQHFNTGAFDLKPLAYLKKHGYINALTSHCLVVETSEGLVLVNTGAKKRLLDQITPLGYRASDVQHIILTHMDADQCAGLSDYPQATVHVSKAEYKGVMGRLPIPQQLRFRAVRDGSLWRRHPRWQWHHKETAWFGFNAMTVFSSDQFDILLVPLPGHSPGHCGVALSTTEGWILHCGDAYFHRDEIKADPPQCPAGLQALQRMLECNGEQREQTQRQLRALYQAQGDLVRLLCAHDPVEFTQAVHYSAYLGRRTAPALCDGPALY